MPSPSDTSDQSFAQELHHLLMRWLADEEVAAAATALIVTYVAALPAGPSAPGAS